MKQKLKIKMLVAASTVLCFASASAQTQSSNQNNALQQTKAQPAVQKPHPVPAANKVVNPEAKKSSASHARAQQSPSREQLLLQRKQAAAKGLPTEQYDAEIKKLNQNQAK